MGVIIAMVKKDLLRRVHQPLGVLLLLSFPLLFSLLLALAFGSGEASPPRIHLLVEDRDEGIVGDFLASAFTSSQAAEHFEAESVGDEGLARMENGEASALLRIPEGFTEALLDGTPTSLELVRNPSQSILPEAAEQMAIILAEGLSSASRALRGPLDELRPLLETPGAPSDASVVSFAVSVNRTVERAEALLFPPAITLETTSLADPDAPAGGAPTIVAIFLIVLPGVSVYALFMLGDVAMRDLQTEFGAGTLQRQLAGPVGAGRVIAAKALFTATLSLISLLILAGFAWAAARRGIDLPAFALLSLALVAAVTGASSVIYGFTQNPRSGGTVGSLLYLFMGFASGSFVQLQSLPPAMRRVAPFTPFYWATQGFSDLLRDGAGLADVLPNIGILAATGASLLALGGVLLRRQIARGAA